MGNGDEPRSEMAVHPPPTVPLVLLNGLLGAAERSGVSRAELLRVAEIHERELVPADVRISRARFERACALAIELSGDAALGLHWAGRLMHRSFGPISEGLAYASTLRQALQLLTRFERFFTNTASNQVIERANEASVRVVSSPDTALPVRRLLAEMSTAWLLKLIRSICPAAPLLRVDFAYDQPPYHQEYAQLFGVVVRFAQPASELTFASSWLDVPSAHAEATTESGAQRTRRIQHRTFSERLHQLIIERAPERLTVPDACRALGIGERSLRRRLAAEGRTFKEVEYEALAQVAKQLLRDQQRTIQETAYEMGFSGASAFHRAFKRWTGTSPSNFQSRAPAAVKR